MIKTINIGLLTIGMLVASSTLANDISSDFLKNEIKLAHAQYLNGSSESGLYALHALARMLESTDSHNLLGPNNLCFTYIRIGLLYEKAGNKPKAQQFFSKAQLNYQGSDVSIVQLKAFVLRLDEA